MRSLLLLAMFTTASLCFAEAFDHGVNAGRPILASSNPIITVAIVRVKPGTEEAFKEAATRILEPTREEAGNNGYDFFQSISSPNDFTTYEQWRSQEDLDKHMQSAHMKEFFQEVQNYFLPGYPQLKTFPAQ